MTDTELIYLFYNPDKRYPLYGEIKTLNNFLNIWQDQMDNVVKEGIKVDVYRTRNALLSIKHMLNFWLEDMSDEIKEGIKEEEKK